MSQTSQRSILPWLIWSIAPFFVFYQFLLQSSPSVMIPQLMCSFAIGMAGIGQLSSSFFYSYVLLQIPSGLLLDRFGPRKVMLGSLVVCIIATVIFATATHPWVAELGRILMGVGSAPSVVCAMCLAVRWFAKNQFSTAAGLVEMMGMLGGAIGMVALARAVGMMSWRFTMALTGILGVILFVGVLFFIFDDRYGGGPCKSSVHHGNFFGRFKKVLSISQVWINCLYCGLVFSVITAFGGLWAIPFLEARLALTTNAAASLSALVFVGTAIGTVALGAIATRFGGCRKLMISFAVFTALIFMCIVYAPGLNEPVMAVLLFLLGFCSGVYVLAFAMVKYITCDSVQGLAVGFTNMMCIAIGAPILQPLIGHMLTVEKGISCVRLTALNYSHALLPVTISLIMAVLLSFWIKDTC